jgi:hypothetical protein
MLGKKHPLRLKPSPETTSGFPGMGGGGFAECFFGRRLRGNNLIFGYHNHKKASQVKG